MKAVPGEAMLTHPAGDIRSAPLFFVDPAGAVTAPSPAAVPAVPAVPAIPEVPIPNSTPQPPPSGIWPWPQSEPWDDATVRKTLRDAMESAKSGDMDTSKRTMVSLGPHLGDRVDLVFHVGVLLKRFEQEDVMRRMIEAAQSKYPDSPEVAKAAQHLLA